jgi:hypothetical protein
VLRLRTFGTTLGLSRAKACCDGTDAPEGVERRAAVNAPLLPPWTAEETLACFVVKDQHGQKLAYVYFEDEPGRDLGEPAHPRRRPADAANLAKLPELLGKG